MHVFLDFIFSILIGITITLIVLNANMVIGEGWSLHNAEMMVQQMLISTLTLVEGELGNIGSGVQRDLVTGSGLILYADSTRIRFAVDLQMNSSVNAVEYRLGNASDVDFGNNNILPLYRSVDDGPEHIVGLITDFSLSYFCREGDELILPAANPGNVSAIEIVMEVQYPHALPDYDAGDPLYSSQSARSRINVKNLEWR